MMYYTIIVGALIVGILGMLVVFGSAYLQIRQSENKTKKEIIATHNACRCGMLKLKTEKQCNYCLSMEAGMNIYIPGNLVKVSENGYELI